MILLRHILTGKDNSTYDVARVLGFLGGLAFLALSVYAVVIRGQSWDGIAFGTGFGTVLGAIGAALWAKRDTEPHP